MKKANATDTLNQTIALLENRQKQELKILKEQFEITYESLKPINIIKKTFTEMTTSSDLKGNIINNVIGMTTGYFTKKLLLGSSHSPIRRILGTVLQFVITNITTKHTESLKGQIS
jgi:hypothetical protein